MEKEEEEGRDECGSPMITLFAILQPKERHPSQGLCSVSSVSTVTVSPADASLCAAAARKKRRRFFAPSVKHVVLVLMLSSPNQVVSAVSPCKWSLYLKEKRKSQENVKFLQDIGSSLEAVILVLLPQQLPSHAPLSLFTWRLKASVQAMLHRALIIFLETNESCTDPTLTG